MNDADTSQRSGVPPSNRSTAPALARRFHLKTIVVAAVILAVVLIALPDRSGDQLVQPEPPRASANHRFVQPSNGSVAGLRSLVAKHPRLIHHYPFEGTSRLEKCQDCRGDLHLTEAVMHAGRGGGRIGYTVEGYDETSEAIEPFRAKQSGNTVGVGLQSEDEFLPPNGMTVELLLRTVAVEEMRARGFVSAAIAIRADRVNRGFLVGIADGGRLVHLLDSNGDWVTSGVKLAPGAWYYVAVTFQSRSDQTVINTYLANLDGEKSEFEYLVENRVAPGEPAAGRLGIGKGFDSSTAHAYPWSGSIDEVAIYDDVLDVETLRKHCQTLMGRTASQ